MKHQRSTAQWREMDAAHHLHPFTDTASLNEQGVRMITHADGIYLWDSEGNKILDGMAGLWCVNIGYGRKDLPEVAKRQMEELAYYNTFFKTSHPAVVELSHLLAEVAYAQMTREGVVRHSVFHGLREDKPASAVGLEKPVKTRTRCAADTPLRLTHPDRVIDASSGTDKRQVAEYYAQVADWILPHLKRRPVALVRAPEGLGGELFFQKNAAHLTIPGLESHTKAEAGQGVMIIDRADTLLGAVQMNTLELHTWNATAKDFDKPDRFVLDLDPDPALPWKAMLEATQLTLALLDELGLQAFLKTSGGKGMHVVVPLTRRVEWDEVKAFSHAIVKHLAGLFPDRLSAVSGPKNRVGRIFIDYLRNARGATTVCAYSLRAREGLPVSVPIRREELTELKSANQWTLHNLGARLAEAEDPWAGYDKTRQSITADLRKRIGLT